MPCHPLVRVAFSSAFHLFYEEAYCLNITAESQRQATVSRAHHIPRNASDWEGGTYPWSHQAATADGASIHNQSEEAVEIRYIEEVEPATMPPGERKSADNTLIRNVVTDV